MGKASAAGELQRARALHHAGVAAGDDGRLADAANLLTEALGLLGLDPDGAPARGSSGPDHVPEQDHDYLAARILISLALPRYELGDIDAGLEVLAHAEQIADRRSVAEFAALIHCQRGLLLARAGRPLEALPNLNEAVRLLAAVSPLEQCKILMNRGEVHHQLGRIRAAERDYAQATEIARAAGEPEFVFRNTHNTGYMAYLAGDLPRALRIMPTVAEATSDYARGVVGLDRARVLLRAGLFQEADATLREASEALTHTDLLQVLAEVELSRAEAALLAQNHRLARNLASQAALRFQNRGNDRLMTMARLVELQAEVAGGLPAAERRERATALATDLVRHRLPDHARTAELIALEAMIDAGETPSAITLHARVGEPVSSRVQLRLVRARHAYATNQPGLARREIRRGLAELSEYQARFGSVDLQTSSAGYGVGLAALAVTADLEAGRPESVLTWLERARAITGRVIPLQPPADEVTADLLTQLRWTVNQLETQEAAGPAGNGLRSQRAWLEQQIRDRSWTLDGSGSVGAEPRVSELRHALGDAVLVAVFHLKQQVYAVVLTERHCWTQHLADLGEVAELGRRVAGDLDVLAMDLVPDSLRRSARGSLSRGLRALDDALIRPLRLPDVPLVLLPPGRLASLTWAELPSLQSRPLVVAPSASTWLGAHARFVSVPGPVVAVAGPGLRRADEEVDQVARIWPGCTVLRPENSTVPVFLDLINGAQLVHVAAHGRHQAENPLFSSIQLGDGPVVGYDLDRVPDPPQQVVLSACDLGRATARPGNEAWGLTRAFLHNGTSTVISGVAKVSDRAAADLMADYHRRLAAGSPPAYALADAVAAADEPIPFACFGAGW